VKRSVKMEAISFPSFEEISEFIRNEGEVTFLNLRDKFNQHGENTICFPTYDGEEVVVAYNINGEFFKYLQEFIRKNNVGTREDMSVIKRRDPTLYSGDRGKFYPVVLYMK
jgi:hypothetical protein